jgi:bacterioferritin-associated ferredoxin
MYICLCKGVTDSQIRQAVCQGACSMRELRQRLGVASQCGKCGHCAQSLLRQTRMTITEDAGLQAA